MKTDEKGYKTRSGLANLAELLKNAPQSGREIRKSSIILYQLLSTSIFLFISGCVSQQDIELACLQTLSASTPVCTCNNSTDNRQTNKAIPTAVPTFPLAKTSNPKLVETPKSANLPSPENIIFKADFESGDLSSFTGLDAEYFGKGDFYQHKIVTNPAIDNYAAALTIGSGDSTAAYLFTYKVPASALGFYSADYYIPRDVVPGDWWNIWQWKSQDNTYNKSIISLDILKHNGVFLVYMYYTPEGIDTNRTQKIIQNNPVEFPADRWVNITGYYMSKSDDSGYVVIYQDGVKIFEEHGIQTKPGNKDVFWSVNSYADRISPNPATIFVDNLSIGEIK